MYNNPFLFREANECFGEGLQQQDDERAAKEHSPAPYSAMQDTHGSGGGMQCTFPSERRVNRLSRHTYRLDWKYYVF